MIIRHLHRPSSQSDTCLLSDDVELINPGRDIQKVSYYFRATKTNYKNKLAKRSVEAVKLELDNLSREWDSVTFSVEPKGAMKIEGDKTTIFKKRG